jgi:hypothetical protein
MFGSSMKASNPSHVRSKEPLSRYGPGRYVLPQCVRLGENTAFGNAYVPLRRYLGRTFEEPEPTVPISPLYSLFFIPLGSNGN